MRKWLFILALSCITSHIHSQSYFYITSQDTNKTFSGFEANIEFNLKLHNTSGSIKNYQWTRTDLCALPSGWNALVCDCDMCYTSNYYQSNTNGSVIDSCTMIFTYLFDLGAVSGSHTSKLEIIDPNNQLASPSSILLSINNGCATQAVGVTQKSMVSIFPIPTEDNITIKGFYNNDFYSVEIESIFGQVIFKKRLEEGQHEMTMSLKNLTNGIYFIALKNKQHQTIQTFKIEKI